MAERPTQIVFWWVIPCKAISGVFRVLAERYEVVVVCASALSDARRRLGWETPDFGAAELVILPDHDWTQEVNRVLNGTRQALHVFGGATAYEKINYAMHRATDSGMQTAVMSEAHLNAFRGLKWIAKQLYLRWVVPWRSRRLVRNSLFVLCLSGGSRTARASLIATGWKPKQVYPFGYFSEPRSLVAGTDSSAANEKVIRLLCTGYLTRAKGHLILLHALGRLKRRGFRFVCEITGYGPEEATLRAVINSLGLDGSVLLRGVLADVDLDALIQRTDIFVAPGYKEPWGIRINEAIQSGLAVVASDGIGASELILSGNCGNAFRSGSVDDLEAKLASLLGDPALIEKYKQHAIEYRDRIAPMVAASHFDNVLSHVLGLSDHCPNPPWSTRFDGRSASTDN